MFPEGGPVSGITLALLTANKNFHIRHDGLSAHKVWTQRNQLTDQQLPIVDRQVVLSQKFSHHQNHLSSAKSIARSHTNMPSAAVSVADLVFLKSAKDKLKACVKYLVVRVSLDLSCSLHLSVSQLLSVYVRSLSCGPHSSGSGSHPWL